VRLASELEAWSAKLVGGRFVVEWVWSEPGLDVLLRRIYRGWTMVFDLARAGLAMVANWVRDLFRQRLDLVPLLPSFPRLPPGPANLGHHRP